MLRRVLGLVLGLSLLCLPAFANDAELLDLHGKAVKELREYAVDARRLEYEFLKIVNKSDANWDLQKRTVTNARQAVENALQSLLDGKSIIGRERGYTERYQALADKALLTAFEKIWVIKIEEAKAQVWSIRQDWDKKATPISQALLAERAAAETKISGSNYAAYEKTVAASQKKWARQEQGNLSRALARYDRVAKNFASFRRRLVERAWGWVDYYQALEAGGDMPRADAMEYRLYKDFAYSLKNKAGSVLSKHFPNAAFRDSTLDFFINFPGSQDRLVLPLHALDAPNFYKFNAYVENEPVELLRFGDKGLPPVATRGTPFERLSMLLSARLVQYFRASRQMEQLVKTQGPILSRAAAFQAPLQGILSLIASAEDYQLTIAKGAESAKKLNDARKAEGQANARLAEALSAFQAEERRIKKGSKLKDVRIRRQNGQWMKARRGGQSALRKISQLEGQITRQKTFIAQIEEQLANGGGASLEASLKRLQSRLGEYRAEKAQIEALASQKPKGPDQRVALQKRVDSARAALKEAQASVAATQAEIKGSDASAPVDQNRWNAISDAYDKLLRDVRRKGDDVAGVFNVSAVATLPSAHPDAVKMAAIVEQSLAALRKLHDTLEKKAAPARAQAGAIRSRYIFLDKKLVLLSKAVSLVRIQAANTILISRDNVGLPEDDPLLKLVEESKKALAQVEGYLDLETTALKALNLSPQQQTDLKTANKVLSTFYELPDGQAKALYGKLNQRVDFAKSVASSGGQLLVAAEVLARLNAKGEPSIKDGFNYFQSVLSLGGLAGDGLPVRGAIWSSYFDFMGKAVGVIGNKAARISEGRINQAIRLNLKVPPENHLYRASEIKDALAALNYRERGRALRILQMRRLIALMQARTLKQAQERSVTSISKQAG
ncbi:MAG: hypothetical protein PVF65_05405 [Sphingomonadales bacterium]|jgi:hypothetical protein